MPEILIQFTAPGAAPTLAEAAALLDVPTTALDPGFGVIATDVAERLFTVLVAASAAGRALAAIHRTNARGRAGMPPRRGVDGRDPRWE